MAQTNSVKQWNELRKLLEKNWDFFLWFLFHTIEIKQVNIILTIYRSLRPLNRTTFFRSIISFDNCTYMFMEFHSNRINLCVYFSSNTLLLFVYYVLCVFCAIKSSPLSRSCKPGICTHRPMCKNESTNRF